MSADGGSPFDGKWEPDENDPFFYSLPDQLAGMSAGALIICCATLAILAAVWLIRVLLQHGVAFLILSMFATAMLGWLWWERNRA